MRILPIWFYDQIRCVFRLPGALRAGNIITLEFIHALPRKNCVPIHGCERIGKVFLIACPIAAVLRLAVDHIADDAVDFVGLLHQWRVAAACAVTGGNSRAYFAGFPDSRLNAVIFVH